MCIKANSMFLIDVDMMDVHTRDVEEAKVALGSSVPLMTRLCPERTFTAIHQMR